MVLSRIAKQIRDIRPIPPPPRLQPPLKNSIEYWSSYASIRNREIGFVPTFPSSMLSASAIAGTRRTGVTMDSERSSEPGSTPVELKAIRPLWCETAAEETPSALSAARYRYPQSIRKSSPRFPSTGCSLDPIRSTG